MLLRLVLLTLLTSSFAYNSSAQYLSFHKGMFVNQYFQDNKKITKRQFNKLLAKNRSSKTLYKKSRVQGRYRIFASGLSIANSTLLVLEFLRKSIYLKGGRDRLPIYFLTSLGTSFFQAYKQSSENNYYRQAIRAYNLSKRSKKKRNK